MTGQYDLFASKAARNAAVQQVADNAPEFIERALSAIDALPAGTIVTGEDVRRILTAYGITPHHHNAWGALIREAVRQQLLRPTGRYRQMRDVSSHARQTAEYIR